MHIVAFLKHAKATVKCGGRSGAPATLIIKLFLGLELRGCLSHTLSGARRRRLVVLKAHIH